MEKITIAFVALILAGCQTTPPNTKVEVVEVYKPILYCPAPNTKALAKPDSLAYEQLTPDSSPGEVAKRYKASVVQLHGYIDRLEKSLMKYDETSKAYDSLKEEFLKQKQQDGFSK